MKKAEDTSPPARSASKLPWTRPTVTLAGTVSMLVRAGSAQGKHGEQNDGDMNQFQVRHQ
jgi:hypothetical protein